MKTFFFETLDSTQTKVKDILAEEGESFSLPFSVRAGCQTGGRGRGGNAWVSPVGNLYVTMVFPLTPLPLAKGGQLSFLASVALFDTLSAFCVTDIRLKWPNDVLVGGRKIAGILLESAGQDGAMMTSVLIGTGVNIVAAPEGAVSLAECLPAGQSPPSPEEFFDRFVAHLTARLSAYERDGFAPVRADWLSRANGLGERIRVRLPQETFWGIFDGLDDNGALIVSTEDGRVRTIHSGDVFFGAE